MYECVSKSFRTESITKYMLIFGITRSEATQRLMAAKPTTLIHRIAIQLHLVAKSCTICSSRSRRVSPETFGYTFVSIYMGRFLERCSRDNFVVFNVTDHIDVNKHSGFPNQERRGIKSFMY
jgi:hypothetical protein